jgi:uncharacterized membrane protein
MYSCVVDTLDRGILVWVGFLVVVVVEFVWGAGRTAGVTGRKEKEGCVVDGIGIELNLAMNLVIFLQLALVGVLYVARCKLEEFMEKRRI